MSNSFDLNKKNCYLLNWNQLLQQSGGESCDSYERQSVLYNVALVLLRIPTAYLPVVMIVYHIT